MASSLRLALEEPLNAWKLNIENKEIKRSPFYKEILHYFCCFTGGNELRSIVSKRGLPKTSEERIVAEKIERLTLNSQSWLYGLNLKPPILTMQQENPIPASFYPIKEGGRFYNHSGERIYLQFIETLRLLFPGTCSKVSEEDLTTWHQKEWTPSARSVEPKITWLGHAGVLIQMENMNLLFDPSFEFVSPCFRRHTKPAIAFENLPLIDVIAVSHCHGDHLDKKHMKKLMPYQPFAFVPEGVDEWFTEEGFTQVEGKTWWERTQVEREGRKLTLTAIPAQHGSATGFHDINRSLWMGIIIQSDKWTIYFAGDTGYNADMFSEIKKYFQPDVVLLPIAPEGEKEMHLDHKDALRVWEELGGIFIPIHYGAYRMGREKIEDPLNQLKKQIEKRDSPHVYHLLKIGETLEL